MTACDEAVGTVSPMSGHEKDSQRDRATAQCAGCKHFAVYGSLMSGLHLEDAPDMGGHLELVGPCTIRGRLYDLGDYPGLVPGVGTVVGELYRLRLGLAGCQLAEALRLLDAYERYDERDLPGSLYTRRVARLAQPDVDAWVYFLNRAPGARPRVPHGNWRNYQSRVVAQP